MITQKTRKHTAWLLIGALAIFSLAAIACSTDPVQSSSTNEESPNIGAPAGVVDGAGPSSVSGGGIVASGYDAPAIEPVSSYGAPALYSEPVRLMACLLSTEARRVRSILPIQASG